MLLLLAVALFVALWAGDHRGPVSQPDERHPRSGLLGRDVGPPGNERTPPVHKRRQAPAVAQKPANSPGEFSTVVVPDSLPGRLPLPGGIVPGEYRVVRSDGRTFHLRLSRRELLRRGLPEMRTVREMYLLHDGRVRWYFIRVTDQPLHVTRTPGARGAPSIVRSPARARKPPRAVRRRDVLRETSRFPDELLHWLHVASGAVRDFPGRTMRAWWRMSHSSARRLRSFARQAMRFSDQTGATRR